MAKTKKSVKGNKKKAKQAQRHNNNSNNNNNNSPNKKKAQTINQETCPDLPVSAWMEVLSYVPDRKIFNALALVRKDIHTAVAAATSSNNNNKNNKSLLTPPWPEKVDLALGQPVLRTMFSSSGKYLIAQCPRRIYSKNVSTGQVNSIPVQVPDSIEMRLDSDHSKVTSFFDIQLSPTEDLIALSPKAAPKQIHIYDLDTMRMVQKIGGGKKEKERIYRIAFSPCGTLLAGETNERHIRLWNVRTGELLQTFSHPADFDGDEQYKGMVFSPSGTLLAACYASFVRFWNVASGKLVQTLAQEPFLPVDPQYIITQTPFFARNGRHFGTVNEFQGGTVTTATWLLPQGDVVSIEDDMLHVMQEPKSMVHKYPKPDLKLVHHALAPNGTFCAVAENLENSSTLSILDLRENHEISSVCIPMEYMIDESEGVTGITNMEFSPDGMRLMVSLITFDHDFGDDFNFFPDSDDDDKEIVRVMILDSYTGQPKNMVYQELDREPPMYLAISPNNQTVAYCNRHDPTEDDECPVLRVRHADFDYSRDAEKL